MRRFSFQNPLGSRFIRPTLKYPTKIMICANFCSKGVGRIHICDGSMNSDSYINVLQNKLLPSLDLFELNQSIFMDDSAPCHRSKEVKEWMENSKIRKLD